MPFCPEGLQILHFIELFSSFDVFRNFEVHTIIVNNFIHSVEKKLVADSESPCKYMQ